MLYYLVDGQKIIFFILPLSICLVILLVLVVFYLFASSNQKQVTTASVVTSFSFVTNHFQALFNWTRNNDCERNGMIEDGNNKNINHDNINRKQEPLVFVAETRLPTRRGVYRVRGYRHTTKTGKVDEIIVIIHGQVEGRSDVPLRVHDQCYTAEVLGSLKCDCREQLESAMDYIRDNEKGYGLIIYLPQEGRGIGLLNKLKAYSLQEVGYDTIEANLALGFEADSREYDVVGKLLNLLGIASVQLLTNNPRKIELLTKLGLQITHRIPIVILPNPHSAHYHHIKQSKMGHLYHTPALPSSPSSS